MSMQSTRGRMLFPSNIEGFFGSTQMTYLRLVETGESSSMTDFPSSNAIKQIEKELERQKVLFEDKVRKGEIVDSNIYFRDFAKRWMEEYAKPRLAPKTFCRYGDYLNRIVPAIGHIKLADLRPLHLNAFYQNLAEPGVNKQGKRDKHGKLAERKPLAPRQF